MRSELLFAARGARCAGDGRARRERCPRAACARRDVLRLRVGDRRLTAERALFAQRALVLDVLAPPPAIRTEKRHRLASCPPSVASRCADTSPRHARRRCSSWRRCRASGPHRCRWRPSMTSRRCPCRPAKARARGPSRRIGSKSRSHARHSRSRSRSRARDEGVTTSSSGAPSREPLACVEARAVERERTCTADAPTCEPLTQGRE